MERRLAGAGNSPALICPVPSSEACAACALKKCVLGSGAGFESLFLHVSCDLGPLASAASGSSLSKENKKQKREGVIMNSR